MQVASYFADKCVLNTVNSRPLAPAQGVRRGAWLGGVACAGLGSLWGLVPVKGCAPFIQGPADCLWTVKWQNSLEIKVALVLCASAYQ